MSAFMVYDSDLLMGINIYGYYMYNRLYKRLKFAVWCDVYKNIVRIRLSAYSGFDIVANCMSASHGHVYSMIAIIPMIAPW